MRLVREAPGRGVRVFIVGAGAAAHLAGVVAAHTTLPVIGVPIDSSALKGLDALLSTVQMPPGVPVATVSIGKPGATNAAVLAAQILARRRRRYCRAPRRYKKKLAEKVEQAAARLADQQADGRQCWQCRLRARERLGGRTERLLREMNLPRTSRIYAVAGLSSDMQSYAIVTFGCRVNQADSLRDRRGPARAGRDRGAGRGGRGGRQHLLGHRNRRSGGATDHPPHRPRQPVGTHRRHRLLRDAAARTTCRPAERRPPRAQQRQGTPDRAVAGDVRADDGRTLRRTATGRAARRSSPASPGGRRSRCGSRPDARSAAAYCIIPSTRGAGTSLPIAEVLDARSAHAPRQVSRKSRSTGVHLGSYGRDLGRRHRSSHCCARSTRLPCRRDVPRQLARADGLHAAEIVDSWPRAAAASRRISTCRSSTRAMLLARMRRPYTLDYYRALDRRHRRPGCRTRRSDRT